MRWAPVLTDGVVTLRGHRDSDLARVVEQSIDPGSVRWTRVPVPYGLEDARRFVRDVMPGGWDADREWGFAIEHEGEYAGTISLRNEGPGRAEIAFGAHPSVRGRDVMERAARLILAWGFSERDLQTVVWYAHVGNWASRRLAWKVGFSFDGTIRGWIEHRGEMRDVWAGTLRVGEPRQPSHRWLDVPRIVGTDVVLRMHRAADAERLAESVSDERTAHWLGPRMPQPFTLALAEEFLLLRSRDMAAATAVHWIVADPVDDLLLGAVSVLRIQQPISGEVGYWTHPSARGHGVMTEAVRLAARHAFIPEQDGGLGLGRLVLNTAEENTASRHVAVAAGFTEVGRERRGYVAQDGLHDTISYDLLPEELRPEDLLEDPGPRD